MLEAIVTYPTGETHTESFATERAAREQRLRSLEREQRHDEVVRAKWVQKQTGCTWTEALRASKTN